MSGHPEHPKPRWRRGPTAGARRSATCGKVEYRTKKQAIRALDRIRAQREEDAPLEVQKHERAAYECARCGHWHLTSLSDGTARN